MLNDLLAVPFVEGGRDISIGLDCYGLCKEIYKRRGIDLIEYMDVALKTIVSKENYSDVEDVIQTEVSKLFEKIENPEPFCLVLLRNGRFVTHIGIVLEDKIRFIHTRQGIGVSVTRLSHILWSKKIEGFYRYVG
jgi:Cell wall-associated hydrolases (invasion-associated proteins)